MNSLTDLLFQCSEFAFHPGDGFLACCADAAQHFDGSLEAFFSFLKPIQDLDLAFALLDERIIHGMESALRLTDHLDQGFLNLIKQCKSFSSLLFHNPHLLQAVS